jgi:hypothetical protein
MEIASIECVAYKQVCLRFDGDIYLAGKGNSISSTYQQLYN